MEQWATIRRRVLVECVSKRQILRETGMHWTTLEKILRHSRPPGYQTKKLRPRPKLDPFMDRIREMLQSDVDAVSFAYVDERSIKAQHGWDCHASHTRTNVCSERFCLRPSAEASSIARIGNVDHTQIVLSAKPDEVYREARACIENAGFSPFVLSTGCEIPFKAPIENIRALARAAQAGY